MYQFQPDKIKELRDANGLTLEQLAEKTGVSKQVLSTWETGACEPRISSLNKVSAAMGIPFDFFFSDVITIVMPENKVEPN